MAVEQRPRSKRRVLGGQTYVTTAGIADYCMVSRSTVGRWVRDGKLSGVRLPSGHYRVSVEDFKDFLKRHNMPISEELQDF